MVITLMWGRVEEGRAVLQEIAIAGQRSYSAEAEKLTALKPINFIFGANGVGKTMISRVINDPTAYVPCSITWNHGRSLACLTYNTDFVERNFTKQLRGIFNLGESASDTLGKIKEIKGKIDEIQDTIDRPNGALGAGWGTGADRARSVKW